MACSEGVCSVCGIAPAKLHIMAMLPALVLSAVIMHMVAAPVFLNLSDTFLSRHPCSLVFGQTLYMRKTGSHMHEHSLPGQGLRRLSRLRLACHHFGLNSGFLSRSEHLVQYLEMHSEH